MSVKRHPIVKQLAKERRLTGKRLEELSDQIGRCQSLMEKYEYGARYPTFPVLCAWVDSLGFDLTLTRKDPNAAVKVKYNAPPVTRVCLHCKKRIKPAKYMRTSGRLAIEAPSRFNKRKFCADCKNFAPRFGATS